MRPEAPVRVHAHKVEIFCPTLLLFTSYLAISIYLAFQGTHVLRCHYLICEP